MSPGTGIGIFSVVLLLFLSKGIGGYVETQMYAGNDPLLIGASKPSQAGGRLDSLTQSVPFSDSELLQISTLEGAASIEMGCYLTGSASFDAGRVSGSLAVLSTVNYNFCPDLKAGSMPEPGEIMINEAVASALSADYNSLLGTHLKLYVKDGDRTVDKSLTICGVIENNGTVAGRFRTAYVVFDDLSAIYGDSNPPVSTVYVTAAGQDAVASIKAELEALGLSSGSRDAALDRIISFTGIVTVGLTGIAAVSLVVSGIMILVVLFISVIERTREIGTLCALGARGADIRRAFMMEGALLGLAANAIVYRRLGVGLIDVNLPHMIDGILIGLGVSIPASLIPATKASKLDPIQSLRHE